MQVGDAELEMRGRCSAGQKVSPSLVNAIWSTLVLTLGLT